MITIKTEVLSINGIPSEIKRNYTKNLAKKQELFIKKA